MSQGGAAEAWAFPPEPSSSREARRRVSTALESRQLEDVATTVALVVSELATNAVLHARTAFEVRVDVRDRYVRVEVHDGTGRRPVRKYFSDTAASGRGLRLIEELCDAWGVEPDSDGSGKTVWAEVNLAGPTDPVQPFDIDAVESL
jgi:anti-sigma regulatory factor (Ser/Thr protein kinase)